MIMISVIIINVAIAKVGSNPEKIQFPYDYLLNKPMILKGLSIIFELNQIPFNKLFILIIYI